MKKHFQKRILSLFLAVLMVTTSLPFVVFADDNSSADTSNITWNEVAKTDFKNSTREWVKNTSLTTGSNYYYDYTDNNGLSWSLGQYAVDFDQASQDNDEGLKTNCGFIHLTGNKGTKNFPTKGADIFKIDVEFKYTGAMAPTELDRYCFFELSNNIGAMSPTGRNTDKMWNNSFFAQDAYGRSHINGSAFANEGTPYAQSTTDYTIGTGNPKIDIGTTYHYVFYYINGFVSSAVVDEYGNTVVTGGTGIATASPDTITGLILGTDDEDGYIENICYQSVTFSTAQTGAKKTVEQGRDKYLFAYFTGNDDQNIRLAVSDDGFNFESLNGNQAVLRNDASNTYPSSTTNQGIPASNNARDPFITRKATNDGYYVIATDLDINKSYGYSNTKLLVWDVPDSVGLANIDTVQPWGIETCDWFENFNEIVRHNDPSNSQVFAWAPEVIWDKDANNGQGAYMMYWTSSIPYYKTSGIFGSTKKWEGNDQKRVFYAYTDNFKDFYVDKLLTTKCGIGAEPNKLFDFGVTAIDANITYDGNLYYLYYKNEDQKHIYYAVSANANGPYAGNKEFYQSDFDDVSGRYTEGCEVYQLYDGSYNFIADCYEQNSNGSYKYDGFFRMYNSSSLTGFENNNQNKNSTINYLTPRHGHVVNITTEEYEALIAKYGKITYDTAGIRDGSNVNDYLVARYFTSQNAALDATGNGYDLTVAQNITFGSDAEHAYSQFTANGKTSANYSDASYASINGSQMLADKNLNVKDGVTFDWYGYVNTKQDYSRFFELTTAPTPGAFSSPTNGSYLFYGSKNGYGMSNANTETDCWGYSTVDRYNSTGVWRHYTLNVTENYVILFVDGTMLGKRYVDKGISDNANRTGATGSTGEGASDSSGSPTYCQEGSQAWLESVFKGNLMFGASSFSGDQMFDGRISDFRIYSKALSPSEIRTSIRILEQGELGEDINSAFEHSLYYDPMEDGEFNGEQKTAYDATVLDPVTIDHDDADNTAELPVHGYVLDTTNKTNSHYTFKPSTVTNDKGVTIAFGYHSGDNIGGDIFNIGGSSGLTVTEDGQLTFNGTVLGTNVLGEDALGIFDWQHYTFQIIKNDGYDTIAVYVGASLTNKINTSAELGNTISNYFMTGSDKSVVYGGSDGYIEDFLIYDGVYSAYSIYEQTALLKLDTFVPRAIKGFEEAMQNVSNTLIYTNLADAYNAYDELKRYRDSINFGRTIRNDQIFAEHYIELRMAMNEMEPYTEPETLEGADVTGYSNHIDAAFTQNMLSEPSFLLTQQTGDTDAEICAGIYTDSFVWLYDGNTMTAPINSMYYRQKSAVGNTYSMDTIYIEDGYNIALGGAGLGDNDTLWHASDIASESAMNWYFGKTSKYYGTVKGDTSHRMTISTTAGSAHPLASSYLRYTGTLTKDDPYSITVVPTYHSEYYRKWIGGSGTYNHQIAPDKTIYIINYLPVKDALENNAYKLQNIADYNVDTVMPLLRAYDNLTAQSYFVQPNADDVKTLTTALETNVNILNGFDTNTFVKDVDKKVINNIAAEAEEKVENIGNNVEIDGENTHYTTSSWNDYVDAARYIRDYFTDLDPTMADENYASEGSERGDKLVNGVAAAEKKLVVVADYEPVETVVSTDKKDIVDENDIQIYAYSPWIEYSDAYDAAELLANKTAAEKADTPKYDNSLDSYNSKDSSTWVVSNQQNEIIDTAEDVDVKDAVLVSGDAAPADYTAYNAATELLKYQDVGAFTDNYINSDSSVYGKVKSEGTKDTSITYANGVPDSDSVTCTTPEFKGVESAYINANGRVYMNYRKNSQTTLDSSTKYVLDALTTANNSTDRNVRRAYTVNYKVIDENNNIVSNSAPTEPNYFYGQIATFNVGSLNCYKWEIQVDGSDPVAIPGAQKYNLTIQDNTTVTAYVNRNTTVDNVTIRIRNIYGLVVNEFSVPADSEFTIDNSYLPNNAVVPCYKLTGWTSNKETIPTTFNVADYAVDGVITLTPVYELSAGPYNITMDNVSVGNNNIYFDTKVTLASELADAYAIAFAKNGKYYVASYDVKSYQFYATDNADFYTITATGDDENGYVYSINGVEITDQDMLMKLKHKLPFTFSTSVDENNSYTTFSAPSFANDAKITEVGTLYVINSAYANDNNFVIGGNGVGVVKAKNPDELSSQYFLKLSNTDGRYVATRSYVKYTYTIDGTTIQFIDYGNICVKNA